MNCTTESKNCQKREMRRWKAKITRKPSPVSKRHWTSFLNRRKTGKHISGSSAQSVTPISYNIGETDNPFILLRLGENYLEMEDETNATEFLLRAYMLEGEKIFKEDWKYFQWLSGHVNLKQK